MITEILNYTIVKKLGEGAMGHVYLAKNKSIHQFVAIKMLHPRFSSNAMLRERFMQEAITLSSLNHPNIVKFLNYVENDAGIFLIMEYVDGMTLEDYINKKTGLIVEQKAYPMMEQILDAFAYAHSHGIIHRDIKPSNIFVTKEGNIKILDFGIAQIISESENQNNVTAGTVEYMSPEQARNQPVDIRSDIYSLGVLFHQMLTGRPPYDTDTMSHIDIKAAIVNTRLRRMKELYPYISDDIQAVVDHATNKTPSSRYDSCAEMKNDIVRLRMSNPAPGDTGGNDDDSGNGGGKSGRSKGKGKRKGLWITICTAAVVVALGVLGYFLYLRNSNHNYVDYVVVNGVPEGIGKNVSSETPYYYRLQFTKGKPSRATYIDASTGQTATIQDSLLSIYKPVDVEFVYNSKGNLAYKNIYDQEGQFLYKIEYDNELGDAYIELQAPDESFVSAAIDSVSPLNYHLTYDDGRLKSVLYRDSKGQPMAYRGIYGEGFKYNSKGQLTEVNYLDANGEVTQNDYGIAYIRFEYDGSLDNAKSRMYDLIGKPAVPRAPKPKVKAEDPEKPRHKHHDPTKSYKQAKPKIDKVKEPKGDSQGKPRDISPKNDDFDGFSKKETPRNNDDGFSKKRN